MPARLKRDASVELGEGDFAVKYNKNGRPVRKSAGQKMSPDLGFVDSGAIDQQLLEFTAEDMSESESDFDSEAEREAAKKKSKKRKRTPSPTPPPLSPLPPPDLPSMDTSPEPFSLDEDVEPMESIEPIHLTFNIEKGFSGPLHVQLNLAHTAGSGRHVHVASITNTAYPQKKQKVKSKPTDAQKKGFLSLPPELRNEVYRMVFKVDKRIDFVEATNMCRSASFLRTCKQVQAEGSSVLYGMNTFYFGRNKELRRPFWNSERKEIGYKDLRLFLDLIGMTNVSHLRNFWLCFDDAAPSAVPHLKRSEERRYVHDPHLIESIKLLAKHAQLEKLTCTFWGRRALALTDARFLAHLTKLKADSFEIKNPSSETYTYFSWQTNRIHDDARTMIKKDIVRKVKLYEDKK